MRLVCPNCGAQYEIETSLIPEAGRDVQCSACAHQWFQRRDGTIAPATARKAPKPAPERVPGTVRAAHEPQGAPPPAAPEAEPAAAEAPAATPPPPRPEPARGLHEDVLSVLREEARREVRARRSAEATAAVETQPDLNLAPEPQAQPAEAAPARPPTVSRSPQLRTDLLPDIEAINATLRAVSEREAEARAAADLRTRRRRRRRGFGTGFGLAAAVSAVAVSTYLFAPDLGDAVPEARPYLQAYVELVNEARSGLDAAMGRSAAGLDRLISQIGT